MWLTFRSYGNYESRAKARSRYMQDTLGGAEKYREAFLAKLAEAEASGEDFSFTAEPHQVEKTGEGHFRHRRVTAQKQDGLYAVAYHPLGGCPDTEVFLRLADAVLEIPEAELRLAPYETAYIVNLTAAEAQRILDITEADSHLKK